MDDIPQFTTRYHGNRPASGVTVRFVPREVVADLQPWRGYTNSAVEESCQDKQKPFMQLHWKEMNSQGSSCLLETNVWVLKWYISIHISKSNEILSHFNKLPLQICGSEGIQLLTCGHSMPQCRQETTHQLPMAVGFPGAVGESRQVKQVFKQCLNLLSELNVLNISNTRMQKPSN